MTTTTTCNHRPTAAQLHNALGAQMEAIASKEGYTRMEFTDAELAGKDWMKKFKRKQEVMFIMIKERYVWGKGDKFWGKIQKSKVYSKRSLHSEIAVKYDNDYNERFGVKFVKQFVIYLKS